MKRKYTVVNLGCAVCAEKIQKDLDTKPELHAKLSFANSTLYVSSNYEPELEMSMLDESIKKYEKDAGILREDEKEESSVPYAEIGRLVLGVALILIAHLLKNYSLIIGIAGYLVISYPILLDTVDDIKNKNFFNESILMSVATIGALALGDFTEAAAVMLLYTIGELFEVFAVDRSRREIKSTIDVLPKLSRVIDDHGHTKMLPISEIGIGQILEIHPGERIPLDSKLLSDKAIIETAMLTGESLPRVFKKDQEVLAGTINTNNVIKLEVLKDEDHSQIAKIFELIEESSLNKAPTEKFITKFSQYYTPIVILGALLLFLVPTILGYPAKVWLYRALIFLVVSCPCALVISVPLSFYSGIGLASKHGILLKGSNYLETLSSIKHFVFDKTGTLTKGNFTILEIQGEKTLYLAKSLERFSNHPLAQIIAKKDDDFDKDAILREEKSGYGLIGTSNDKLLLIGNKKLMEEYNISLNDSIQDGSQTIIHVAYDGIYQGHILLSDTVKKEAKPLINELKARGIQTTMLTGDHENVAQSVARELGIDHCYSELLPQDKVTKIKELEAKEPTAFLGDGINDAPVLHAASVGISMGSISSDAAIEASDVVLSTDNIDNIPKLLTISKLTRDKAVQNIIFSLVVKSIVLVLSAFGLANMWYAIIADVGVTILAIINASSLLRRNIG